MFIQLVKPFPQPSLGKVIPAGVAIDAPPGLAERLLRQGIGIHAGEGTGQQSAVATPKKERSENKRPAKTGKGRGKQNG